MRTELIFRPSLRRALLAAAVLAGAVALGLPIAWPLQLLAGGLVYLVVCWVSGVLSMNDVATLRAIVLSKRGA